MGRLLLLFALLTLAFAQKKDYTGHRLISVHAQNRDDVEALAKLQDNDEFEELDFWSEPSIVRPTDIRVSPNDYGKLRAALNKAKLIYTVVKDNVQEMIDKEAESMARSSKIWRNANCDIANNYCTYEQIQTYLDQLEATAGGLVSVSSIGQSYEGRDIPAVKISSEQGGTDKQSIYIECGAHAREWIAISSCMNLIKELSINEWMQSYYDWYVVPVLNPDGYIYSQTDRLWRKNRQGRDTCLTGYGTDLNRNWDVDFGKAGTSSICYQSTYPGKNAFSAPETAALRDAVINTPNLFAFFSVHCYSQMMLVPFAYQRKKPANYNHLEEVAQYMMDRLEEVEGRTFNVGTPPDILYAASGGSYDYFYLNNLVEYSYTYELRPATAGDGGFELGVEHIKASGDELIASLIGFVERVSG